MAQINRDPEVGRYLSIIHPVNERSQRVAVKLGIRRRRQVENPMLGTVVDVWHPRGHASAGCGTLVSGGQG
jgi:RimJ/RimL family protein N-acetyltransferase